MALIARQRYIDDQETYTLHISSADRDLSKWPNPYEYEIELPTQNRQIQQMTMLTAEFCNTQYVIDASNNKMLVDAAVVATPDVVTITPGTYTPTTLAAAMVTAIDATASVGAVTTIAFDTDTQKYTISNANATGLTFLIGSSQDSTDANYDPSIADSLIWRTIGFHGSANLTAAPLSASSFTSDQMVNLKPDPYLILEIVNNPILVGRMESSGPHALPFAKIIFAGPSIERSNQNSHDLIQNNPYDFVAQPVVFNQITRIKRFRFRLRRPNGAFADHNGVDHSFTLQLFACDGQDRKRRRVI